MLPKAVKPVCDPGDHRAHQNGCDQNPSIPGFRRGGGRLGRGRPLGRSRLPDGRGRLQEFPDGGVLFQSQIAGILAHKAAVENSAGELFKLLVLDGPELADPDFRLLGNLFQGNLSRRAFSSKSFTQ